MNVKSKCYYIMKKIEMNFHEMDLEMSFEKIITTSDHKSVLNNDSKHRRQRLKSV